MGYLEKVFLGTMVLFLSVVITMFGLYFDLHAMFLGASTKSEPLLAAGEFAYTRSVMERIARPVEIMPRSLGNSHFGVPSSDSEIAEIYSSLPAPMSGPEVVAWWRQRLKEQGMQEGELLDLEAMGHDRQVYNDVIERVDRAVKYGDFDTAVSAISEAIRQTDSTNLHVLRDLLLRLSEVYNLMGRSEEAGKAATQLSVISEKLLDIRARSLNSADLAAQASNLARSREGQIPEEAEEPMTPTEMKARLLKAYEARMISRQEMEDAMEHLR